MSRELGDLPGGQHRYQAPRPVWGRGRSWRVTRTRGWRIRRTTGLSFVLAWSRFGLEIAREVTVSRWCVVAGLLRLGAVQSWAEVGEAIGVSEVEVLDGFRAWITRQVDLHRRTGTLALTGPDAEQLYVLAEAVNR